MAKMIARLGELDTWEETIVLGLTEQRLLKLVRSLEGTLADMPLELLRELLSGRIPTGAARGLIFLFWKPGKPRRAVMARRWLCALLPWERNAAIPLLAGFPGRKPCVVDWGLVRLDI